MAVIRKSFLVRAPANRVFDALVDHTHYTRWFDFIKKVTYDDKIQVGKTSHWITEIAGIKGELDVEYKELVPGRKVQVENVGPFFRNSSGTFLLTEKLNETQVDFEIHYEIPTLILGQLLDRLVVSRELEKGFERGFERLKQAIENELLTESRGTLSKYFWSMLGSSFDGPLSSGYVILAAEDPESPAERFLLPLFQDMVQKGFAKLIIASTDLPKLSFEETIATPMKIDMADTYFVDLTGTRGSDAAQPVRTLTDIGLALTTARQAVIETKKIPLVLFHHLDPLMVRFGVGQVSKFLHETAVKVRNIGSFECYLLTRMICSEHAYASLVSLSDATLRFQRSKPNGSDAEVELVKCRGVRSKEFRIPLQLDDNLRYTV